MKPKFRYQRGDLISDVELGGLPYRVERLLTDNDTGIGLYQLKRVNSDTEVFRNSKLVDEPSRYQPYKPSSTRHWSEDKYWLDAFEDYQKFLASGQRTLTLDMGAIQQVISKGDGPAYRLLYGMLSVNEHEGWDGLKGAPRLLLATLMELAKLKTDQDSPGSA